MVHNSHTQNKPLASFVFHVGIRFVYILFCLVSENGKVFFFCHNIEQEMKKKKKSIYNLVQMFQYKAFFCVCRKAHLLNNHLDQIAASRSRTSQLFVHSRHMYASAALKFIGNGKLNGKFFFDLTKFVVDTTTHIIP